MHNSHARSVAHVVPLDGRHDLAAAIGALAPTVAARIEALALYVMVAALWGVVLFVGLTAFAQQ